jgi:hypothetical protein
MTTTALLSYFFASNIFEIKGEFFARFQDLLGTAMFVAQVDNREKPADAAS